MFVVLLLIPKWAQYHQGFREMADKWPVNPLDTFISYVKYVADSPAVMRIPPSSLVSRTHALALDLLSTLQVAAERSRC